MTLSKCLCGCGLEVKKPTNKYINGHNNRNKKMSNSYKIKGDITELYLSRKDGTVLTSIIDTEDLKIIKRFKNRWYAAKNKMGNFYVYGDESKGNRHKGTFRKKTHLLHRWIANPPKNMVVDHINHNTLDNRKSNLRVVTQSENKQNTKSPKITGVYKYHYDRDKWIVVISVNGKSEHFGIFKNKQDAIRKAEEVRRKYHPYYEVESKHVIP